MKLKIIALMMCVFMSLGVVAQLVPSVFNGRVESDGNVQGLTIVAENLRNNDIATYKTTEAGEFIIDISEFENNVIGGDDFKISVSECGGEPQCVKEVEWNGEPQTFLLFDISGAELPEPEPEPETAPEAEHSVTPNSNGKYASTDLFYGQEIDVKIDNKKVSKLIDDEIDFDGENIEVKEEIYFKGIILTSIDDKDFGTRPYLTMQEGGLEYRYIFDEEIDLTQVSEDEPLEIVFLGKKLKIIKASANEIEVRTGTELFLSEGDSQVVEGHTVSVLTVTENSVLVSVDGLQEVISLDNEKTINKFRVRVDEILYKGFEGSQNYAQLIVGDETDETIKGGDYFELLIKDDETWEWEIRLDDVKQRIGVRNVERYDSIDPDDDYLAVGVGGAFSLPNNFLPVTFVKVTEGDRTEFTAEVKDGFLYIKSGEDDAFNTATEEYDRLYIDNTGFHDEDKVFITADPIEIGDSNVFLELGSLVIKDLKIELDLSDILFKGVSFANKDETFMDYLGIIFSDPEQAVDDQDGFRVSVSDERPEALIAFGDYTELEPAEPIVITEEVPGECVDEGESCPACPVTEKEIVYRTKTCPVCDEECSSVPEGGFNWMEFGAGIIIALIVSLIAYMGGGIKIYKNRAGSVTIQHRHKGIRGYHDANTKHNNPRYSHRRWKDDPLGCIDDVKIIEETGGLT